MNKVLKTLYLCLFGTICVCNAWLICYLLIDTIHEITRNCDIAICYWGAESMGWLWHSPLTYVTTFGILAILMSFGTGTGIYKLIKCKFMSAFLWMLSPTLVLGLFILILQFQCQGEKGQCIETAFYLPIFEILRYTMDEL